MINELDRAKAQTIVDKVPRKSKGKYRHVPRKEEDGLLVEMHEYETPKGEVGYQYIVRKQDGEDVYVMAKASGVEAKERTFDWRLEDKNPV